MSKSLTNRWSFTKDLLIINSLGAGLVLNIVLWVWLALKLDNLAGEIPLHYIAGFGPDVWGEPTKLYYLPAFGLIVLIINFLLLLMSWRWEKMAARLLAVAIVISQIILLVAGLLLITLDFNL
ncbi:hypothetical protein ACFL0Z_00385 [Patescibacteria group bacterium]